MSDEELEGRLHDARQELFNLRFQSATGALETTTPRRSWRRPRSPAGFGSRTIGFRFFGCSRFGFVRAGRCARGRRLRFFFFSDTAAG